MPLDEELSPEEGEAIAKKIEELGVKVFKDNGFEIIYFGDGSNPNVVGGQFPRKALKVLNEIQQELGDLIVELLEAERQKRRPIAYTKHGHTVHVASAADVQALEAMLEETRVLR